MPASADAVRGSLFKEWVMTTIGRRTGLAAFAGLLFCLGVMGCLSTQDDFQPVLQQNATGPGALLSPASTAALYGDKSGAVFKAPGATAYAAPSEATRGQIQQTAYRAPITRVAAVQAPAENGLLAQAPPAGAPPGTLTPDATQMPLLDNNGMPPPGPNTGPGPGGPRPMPNELIPTSHPPYRVAPPDILLIDALRVVPKGPYRLEPLEMLQISVSDTLPNQAISGPFLISPEGTVSLGYNYGNVRVGGLSLEQAQQAIYNHLSNILKNPTVNLAVTQFRGLQQVAGQHLVRPDGTVGLGTYGSVYVAGLTLGQVKAVLERYLSEYLVNPQIAVDVLAYNSQKIYMIVDGGGFGQQVIPLPVTGNETVLDAVSSISGLAPVSSKRRIWIARPSPCNMNANTILPVDWQAIVMNGQTCTNYQLFPGDRVYIGANPIIQFDNRLAQILSPIERIFGGVLLGNFTVRSFQNTNGSGTNTGLLVP
jgi:polysaccharide biosynthesis/export protein